MFGLAQNCIWSKTCEEWRAFIISTFMFYNNCIRSTGKKSLSLKRRSKDFGWLTASLQKKHLLIFWRRFYKLILEINIGSNHISIFYIPIKICSKSILEDQTIREHRVMKMILIIIIFLYFDCFFIYLKFNKIHLWIINIAVLLEIKLRLKK